MGRFGFLIDLACILILIDLDFKSQMPRSNRSPDWYSICNVGISSLSPLRLIWQNKVLLLRGTQTTTWFMAVIMFHLALWKMMRRSLNRWRNEWQSVMETWRCIILNSLTRAWVFNEWGEKKKGGGGGGGIRDPHGGRANLPPVSFSTWEALYSSISFLPIEPTLLQACKESPTGRCVWSD